MIVKLKVDSKMYADYIAYLFPPGTDGALKVSSEHMMGKLLIAHCREAPRPMFESDDDLVVTLRLPQCESTQNLRNKFLYYNAGDMLQLNKALQAAFEFDFVGYYRRGQALQFAKKDIVEGFVTSRKLISTDCVDALYKRVYRRQQREAAALVKKLIRKAYYLEESIDASGLPK